jgi:hypothetical protein
MNKNNTRRYPDKPGPRPDLTDLKRSEAKDRQAAYDALSLDEKIAKLDFKFGKGIGAVKERAKLANTSKSPVKAAVAPDETNIVSDAPKRMKAKDRRKQDKKETNNEE